MRTPPLSTAPLSTATTHPADVAPPGDRRTLAEDGGASTEGARHRLGRTPAERARLAPPEGAPHKARARELEGYRGVAAISIIVFHVYQYAIQSNTTNPLVNQLGRFEIVDILFVLSAYLLTLPYARAALNQGSLRSSRQFLFRRAVRILPLYWLGILVVWGIRNPGLPGDWRDLIEHLTFTQVFDRKRIFYTLGPSWSMSLEVMFYAVLVALAPLAYRACAKRASRQSRVKLLLAGCAALFLATAAWNSVAYLVFHVPFDNWPVYFGPQARFSAFAVGMALAVLVAAREGKPLFRGWAPTLVRLAAAAIVGFAWWIDRRGTWGQVAFHDIAALGWMLLLGSTVLGASGQRWSRMLSWRALTWIGLISYSTYIWHEPVMLLLNHFGVINRSIGLFPWSVLVVLVASIGAGLLSYWVIEYPTSKLGALHDRDGRPREYYPELSHPAPGGSRQGRTESDSQEYAPSAEPARDLVSSR